MTGEKTLSKMVYKLELTEEEMNTILASFAKVPFSDMQGFADDNHLTVLKWSGDNTENSVFYQALKNLVFNK